MQALIPVFTILGVAAGAQLTLLPYAYLADPLPVYHQSQDTRLGVHAYSYAGGPSAKEEVRGLDGVTRGSYSYVDPYGVLQSVFYVADEGGFRVAATNLPTDGDLSLETGEVLLARNAHLQELTRDAAAKMEKKEEGQTTSRRKRSLEALADQDRSKAENSSSQKDQADQITTNTSLKSSHELPAPEKKTIESRAIVSPVYGLLDSVLIPRLAGAATSHQSRVDVHNNIRLKAVQPIETIGVLTKPDAVILPSQIPLATSHQSRVQVHNSLRVEAPEKLVKNAEAVEVQALPAAVAAINLEPLSLVSALPDYNENRIQLHKNLGLEGPNRKDTVKIDALPAVPIVKTPIATLSAVPVITQKALLEVVKNKTRPFVISIPNSNNSQIQRDASLEVTVPIVSEPTIYVASSYAQPIATWPILAPVAQSSQYRSQIHSNEKIELAK